MAHYVMKTTQVTINSVDLSDRVQEATLTYKKEAKETTASGDNTRKHVAGLTNWEFSCKFKQDYAAGKTHATLFPLISNGTEHTIAVRPTSAAKSATNPSFEGTAILTDYDPIAGAIGDLASANPSWVPAGDLSEVTS